VGPTWQIAFRHEKGGLKNHVGARRLARILKAGGGGLESLDLYRETGSPKRTAMTAERVRQSRQADAGLVLDKKTVRAYTKRREELEQRIGIHQAAGHEKKAAQMGRELDWLKRELRSWVGKGGISRAFPEEHEHARQTISHTVHDEILLLKDDMPLLFAHLNAFVHLGYLCWYEPEPPEPWDIAL
jgi:hypothetical protein